MRYLLLMLLIGCAHWQPTEKAVLRRQAEGKLRSCMQNTHCKFTRQCIQESVEWCKEHGMEKTCGTDGVFVDPIMCSNGRMRY